jgi:hypothetical protein
VSPQESYRCGQRHVLVPNDIVLVDDFATVRLDRVLDRDLVGLGAVTLLDHCALVHALVQVIQNVHELSDTFRVALRKNFSYWTACNH